MCRSLSIAFLSAMFVYALSIVFAPAALAAGVVCDVSACISYCQKQGPSWGAGHGCTSYCLQTIDERKKAGKCPK